MAKIEIISIFLQFFVFFSVFRQVSKPIMTCLLFCDHLDTLLDARNFSLDLCAFVILKN